MAKQVVILSGKGGTGKTSLAAALAHLAQAGPFPRRATLADADVDAANLELVLRPQRQESHPFSGGSIAILDQARCQECGICFQVCRFEAIYKDAHGYHVDPLSCEGCAACVYQCPEGALNMQPRLSGQWHRSQSRFGTLFHADLLPAAENSGKLVAVVRQNARQHALDKQAELVIIDGPPGIGCPVIAAASGTDLALIVTEPSLAGLHDLERVLQTTRHFRLPALVVINKADLYPEGAAQILAHCAAQAIPVIGQIPFDPAVGQALTQGEPVTAYAPAAPASLALRQAWEAVVENLE